MPISYRNEFYTYNRYSIIFTRRTIDSQNNSQNTQTFTTLSKTPPLWLTPATLMSWPRYIGYGKDKLRCWLRLRQLDESEPSWRLQEIRQTARISHPADITRRICHLQWLLETLSRYMAICQCPIAQTRKSAVVPWCGDIVKSHQHGLRLLT